MSLSRPFWDACREGRLVVQRCRACGAYEYPPLERCGGCQRDTLEWAESSGRGIIHSASTVHRPRDPEWSAPYVVAIIRMDEGWHIASNVIDCDAADVAVGSAVVVTFRERSGRMLPLFRLDDSRERIGMR